MEWLTSGLASRLIIYGNTRASKSAPGPRISTGSLRDLALACENIHTLTKITSKLSGKFTFPFGIFRKIMVTHYDASLKKYTIIGESETKETTLNPSLPCWLPWRWNPGRQARWSPAPTGNGCRSEATPPLPCTSETHHEMSVGAGLRIIHSGRISSAARPIPSPARGSRSCTAPARQGGRCWGLWRRRWAHRWSSCVERRAPWYERRQNGRPGRPYSYAPAAWCTERRPAEQCSGPRPGPHPPVGH